MNPSDGHEAGLAQFVVEPRRARIAALLGSPRGRAKFISDLPHFRHWDPGACVALGAAEQTPSQVLAALQRLGAPAMAYLLSASPALDARSCPLAEAVRDVVGSSTGTVISCAPGKLAYYEGPATASAPDGPTCYTRLDGPRGVLQRPDRHGRSHAPRRAGCADARGAAPLERPHGHDRPGAPPWLRRRSP